MAGLRRKLRELYGDATRIFSGAHHARYIEPDVPLHIISRVFQGRHLLRPSKRLNRLIVGVLARARELYPDVSLYAVAFMSNHLHMQAMGPAPQLSAFVGFVKREISRRWAKQCGVAWSESMWSRGYHASALPTAESQLRCLRYILSQGVKEGLVAKPTQWPGVHAAHTLLTGAPLRGEWFDGTGYGRRRDAEGRKVRPGAVRKADYYRAVEVHLDPIASWTNLSAAQRRLRIRVMLEEIEREGRDRRGGKRPLGIKRIVATPLNHRTELAPQPWFEDRHRFICWERREKPEVQAYLARYCAFQRAFRAASKAFRNGQIDARFPHGAFRPPSYAGAPALPG